MPIQIHGKSYITVAERVKEAGKDLIGLNTEVLFESPVVVIKAIVTTNKGTFTGISSANPLKSIEKSNPYEVAETSAVGRALGFAGYGIVEGIASADEMVKSQIQDAPTETATARKDYCSIHDKTMKERTAQNGGHYYDHRWQNEAGEWQKCNGKPKNDIPERQINEDDLGEVQDQEFYNH